MQASFTQIIQHVKTSSDLNQSLPQVVGEVKQVLQADACSIFLSNDAKSEFILTATKGLDEKYVQKTRLKFDQGLVGLVAQREEPINLDDSKVHANNRGLKLDQDYNGFLGVPIINGGKVLGVLVAQKRDAQFFSDDDEAFAVTLAIQLAPIIAEIRALQAKTGRGRGGTTVLTGISGARGIVMGSAVVIYPLSDLDAVPEQKIEDIEVEVANFEKALQATREEIQRIQQRARETLSVTENAIFDVYLRMLDSRSFINAVIEEINTKVWAQTALKRVIQQHINHFESLEDDYLRERASDFRDLGRHILAQLQSAKKVDINYPKRTILVSEEVSPTMLMDVPEGCLIGVISAKGAKNSHLAILTRALGLPTVLGISETALEKFVDKECIIDGYGGQVYLSPTPSVRKEFQILIEEEQQLDAKLEDLRELPAETKDKKAVGLYVNTGLAVEGGLSLSVGAEGVGLYRTEMPFMIRDRFPSEEEQRIMYRQLLSTFAPRPVIMRTLDIGGDKNLPYFSFKEENPFLGWRGVRITLDHPEIFLQQVRAMLQANIDLNNLAIMLPMVTSITEVDSCLQLIQRAYNELLDEGFSCEWPNIGLMIEVPAAAYQAYELAKRVDFLSVGSNDLIQYLLAVDRNNPRVAKIYDGLHPAVLRALQHVVKAGHKAGKTVSICGELAGDPMAVILLMAMGFDTLSMNARSLPRVKWVVRQFTLTKAKQLLTKVLKMDEAKDVHQQMEQTLEQVGLGGLIRAGK